LCSSTSVAAKFRAFTRGISETGKFCKLCIVLEEIDESSFWLELIEEAQLMPTENLNTFQNEALELLKIFSTTRKKIKK